MTNTVRIELGTLDGAAERFTAAWHRAEGALVDENAEVRLTFEDMPTLLRTLTAQRWRLLTVLRRNGASSVRGVAKALGRDYRNVHDDVKRLLAVGLVARDEQGKVYVPFDVIGAELRFDAA